MPLWILSDPHRAFGLPWMPPAIPGAGDADEGVEASLAWLAGTIRPRMRTVFVAGDHGYRRTCTPDEPARGRAAAVRLGVDFPEEEPPGSATSRSPAAPRGPITRSTATTASRRRWPTPAGCSPATAC